LVIWLFGYLVIWLFGYLVIWLFGYLIIWLFGYLVFGHADAKSFSHAPASLPGPAPSLVPRQNARPSAVIDTSDATAQSATTIRLVSSGVSESPSFISTALLVPLVAFSNCEQNTTSY
jgi:predicted PurR-regulated permease PerM